MSHPPVPRLRLRLLFPAAMIGPGKVELLERIRDTGSISAAGRAMGMSYRRAWSLVEEMNAAFRAPLVASSRGGAGGGGAHLTEAGAAVLAHYHAVLRAAAEAGAGDLAALAAMLRDMPDGK
ncbi:MAG: hypothetical protein RIR62_852 [Pseudomonadota bacterium]|jgi:molybdate transport system regulatory protein